MGKPPCNLPHVHSVQIAVVQRILHTENNWSANQLNGTNKTKRTKKGGVGVFLSSLNCLHDFDGKVKAKARECKAPWGRKADKV